MANETQEEPMCEGSDDDHFSSSDTEDEDNEVSEEQIESVVERNRQLRAEYDKLKQELKVEILKQAEEDALSRELEESRKRLQAEIAELEITRRKLMAEKVFWDFVSNYPDYDHWSDFFNKNRLPSS